MAARVASEEPRTAPAAAEAADPRHPVPFAEPPATRPSTRPSPIHLHPLATSQIDTHYRRPSSGPSLRHPSSAAPLSPDVPDSADSLATPSLRGVRQYYHENGLYTAFQASSPGLAPSLSLLSSRRASAVSPSGLTPGFYTLQVASPHSPAAPPRAAHRRSIADESRDMLLAGVNSSELSRLGSVVTEAKPGPSRRPSAQALIPGKPLQDHLRGWGSAYLGNAATADVFVRALHIRQSDGSREKQSERRDSVISNRSDDGLTASQSNVDHVLIRARVLPRSAERKPFLIQRRFDRANMPTPSLARPKKENSAETDEENPRGRMLDAEMHPRSKSISDARTASSHSPTKRERPAPMVNSKKKLMPIHMDYALRYLPILGMLMLSGHIRRGDTIDLPLPHPEAWNESIAYAYTGLGKPSELAIANIEYLAGTVGPV